MTDVFIAGAIATVAADLTLYPLDTLTTRLQSQDSTYPNRSLYKYASSSNTLFRGLYQGVGVTLLTGLPASCLFLVTYERLKSDLRHINQRQSGKSLVVPDPVICLVASSVADMIACLIETPAVVLKKNAQLVQKSKNAHIASSTALLSAVRKLARPQQLWTGYWTVVAHTLPYSALFFPMFEFSKDILRNRVRNKSSRRTDSQSIYNNHFEAAAIAGVSGAISGGLAAAVLTPVDVWNTRIVLNIGEVQKKSAMTIAREIVRLNGIRGFFKGGAVGSLHAASKSALFFGIYEWGGLWLASSAGMEKFGDL
ncbi:hypothetical protein O988_05402 [Pseudogymnoascus sp. VKM F-3808]|nr:hypothetical protein O988_05402 [Pseudogymnoascus sp. VKM F-3808]